MMVFLYILFLLELFLVWKGVMCMFEKCVSFVGVLFLIFEKSDEQKIAPEILRFVSMLFNVIINVSIF